MVFVDRSRADLDLKEIATADSLFILVLAEHYYGICDARHHKLLSMNGGAASCRFNHFPSKVDARSSRSQF